MRSQLQSVLVALALSLSVPAAAADQPGTATVRQVNDKLQTLLKRKTPAGSAEEKQQAAEINAKLQSFLDVDELGRRAMRDQWSKLTPAQQAEFTKLLREIVEGHYVRALRSELDYTVAYLGEKPTDDETTVSTELRLMKNGKKQVIGVDYALRKDKGNWRVFDIVTDGVGLVENYRAQFNQVIAKEGIEGLLARMRKKTLAQ
ncbi:MAG TPA: ABC transporter substrate-binding protein [Polyangiaceae bacterium]|nr:ABC transporter substrate-binding protein [Polyangiaceae bacterium]